MRPTWPLFIATLPLAFCLAVPEAARAQSDLPEQIEQVRQAVVTIVTQDAAGRPLAQGSGFFRAPDAYLVTNRHVLVGAASARVTSSTGRTYLVEYVVADDAQHDLVLLRIAAPRSTLPTIRLADSTPRVGEPVFVVGAPLGLEATVSDGIVSAVRSLPEFGEVIQVTAPISPGSSGSPVMNGRGEVIGIATAGIEGQSLNFAIPASRARALIPTQDGTALSTWARATAASSSVAPAPSVVLRGARIRVTVPGSGIQRLSGTALGMNRQGLVFRPDELQADLVVPRADITRLELSRGRSTSAQVWGAVLGAVVGAVPGAVVGRDICFGDLDPCELTPGENAFLGAFLFGGLGSLAGWAIGYYTEGWQEIPIESIWR